MECMGCEWVKEAEKLYEDERVIAFLAEEAISAGHVIVLLKKHYTILEQVPDYEVSHLAKIANKLSIVLFESLKIQGTNMLIQNGIAAHQTIPHLMIHIVPRLENDGLNFQWRPRQLSEEEMSTIELQLKDAAKTVGSIEKEKPKPIDLDKKPEEFKSLQKKDGGTPESAQDGQENQPEEINYLIRQLERLP
jgi:histidine triad (HIT) family protein